MRITLKKAVVEKGGNIGYRREGVRATVYFNKNMFKDPANAPESVDIEVPGDGLFTEPGDVKAGARELTEEQKAKLAEQARKAEAAAQKAAERASKAAEKAAKLGISVEPAPAQTAH